MVPNIARIRPSRAALAGLAATLALGGAPPVAGAAGQLDQWTRWVTPGANREAHVRSLDFTTNLELWAATEGDGVFQSANAGTTWQSNAQLNGGLLGNASAMNVRQIITEGAVVYAATSAGVFRRNGAIWVPLGQGAGPGKLNLPVQALRKAGATILAGTASAGIWRSTDSGDTWVKAAGLPVAESVWHIIGVGPILYAAGSSGVFRSTDGGASWSLRSDGIPGAAVLRLGVSPANPLHLYAAASGAGVYRSTTGGETWTYAGGSGDFALPGTVRAMLVAPSSFGTERLLAGTDKGVWATMDNGTTWRSLSKASLLSEPAMKDQIVWALGFAPVAPGVLFAGTQANGVYAIPFAQPTKAAGSTPTTGAESPRNVGVTLTADPGTWTGTDPLVFAFQWQRCSNITVNSCDDIAGATSATYVLGTDDADKRVRVKVSVTGFVGAPFGAEAASAVSAQVNTNNNQLPPNEITSPAITPNDMSKPWGTQFTANPGTWPSGTTLAYAWQRCTDGGDCTPIPGATASLYTARAADVGFRLAVAVTGTKNGASKRIVTNATFTVIERKPVNTELPQVLGDPYPGRTLDSKAGAWIGTGIEFFRQWQLCEADGSGCTSVIGGQGQTLTILPTYKGKRLRLRIEAKNGPGSGFQTFATSELTPVITDPPVEAPAGAGAGAPAGGGAPVAQQQQQPSGGASGGPVTLATPKLVVPKKLKTGKVLKAPVSIAGASNPRYQWLRNGRAIRGATKRTYRLTRRDRGARIAVRITVSTSAGTRVLTSAAVKIPRR